MKSKQIKILFLSSEGSRRDKEKKNKAFCCASFSPFPAAAQPFWCQNDVILTLERYMDVGTMLKQCSVSDGLQSKTQFCTN